MGVILDVTSLPQRLNLAQNVLNIFLHIQAKPSIVHKDDKQNPQHRLVKCFQW